MAAASIPAFGSVYIGPFEDGNGRLHRYLVHHELARSGFNPLGIVFHFPVSAPPQHGRYVGNPVPERRDVEHPAHSQSHNCHPLMLGRVHVVGVGQDLHEHV